MTDSNLDPLVSIGMPLYNAESTIHNTLEAILNQTYTNLEIIISDNASTDKTAEICQRAAQQDHRIRLTRQDQNIGAAANFKFVLDNASGSFFMWAAADDVRSPDFIQVNLKHLLTTDCVASTSPDCFDSNQDNPSMMNRSSVCEKTAFLRYISFLMKSSVSRGLFYSLIRTDILRSCPAIGSHFFAADWAILLFLAKSGALARTDKGCLIVGSSGISSSVNCYSSFHHSFIDLFIPLRTFNRYAIQISGDFSILQKCAVVSLLFGMNILMFINRYIRRTHLKRSAR